MNTCICAWPSLLVRSMHGSFGEPINSSPDWSFLPSFTSEQNIFPQRHPFRIFNLLGTCRDAIAVFREQQTAEKHIPVAPKMDLRDVEKKKRDRIDFQKVCMSASIERGSRCGYCCCCCLLTTCEMTLWACLIPTTPWKFARTPVSSSTSLSAASYTSSPSPTSPVGICSISTHIYYTRRNSKTIQTRFAYLPAPALGRARLLLDDQDLGFLRQSLLGCWLPQEIVGNIDHKCSNSLQEYTLEYSSCATLIPSAPPFFFFSP